MLETITEQKLSNGNSGRTGTIYNDLCSLFVFACNFHSVNNACEDDDGSTVLIIVEYRNIQEFFQSFLNFKTAWSTDIFQVDATKCRCDIYYSTDDFFCILCIQTDWYSINTTKFFEEDSLTFHNRHTCQSTDVTESQYGTSVRDNGNCICFHCISVGCRWILGNNLTRFCYTWSICDSQIFPCSDVRFGSGFNLTIPFLVHL